MFSFLIISIFFFAEVHAVCMLCKIRQYDATLHFLIFPSGRKSKKTDTRAIISKQMTRCVKHLKGAFHDFLRRKHISKPK